MPTITRVAVIVAAAAIFFSTFHSVSGQGVEATPATTTTATPPTSTATPPTSTATPPTSTATPPTSTATPPTLTATPPTTTAVSPTPPPPLAPSSAVGGPPAPTSSVVSPSAPSPLAGCKESLRNVSSCKLYLMNGSTTTTPDTDCCPELAGLAESNPRCLCVLFGTNTTESLGVAIDVKKALKLPSVCGVQTPSCRDVNQPSKGKMSLILIVMIPLVVVFVLASAIVCIYLWRRKMAKRQENRRSDDRNRVLHTLHSERHLKDLMGSGEFREEDEKGIDIPFFDLESILTATDNFSNANKLGEGGYGPVYKGTFSGGQEIAIKRLSSVSRQGLQEFKNEVVLIAKLQHRNLVRLRGYCTKGDEKILLYEYMPNRSLDSFIFDQRLSICLDWEMRVNIILGIARGLLYLHHDSRLRIIHRDLKTSNILLDEEMNPKISDFGLARIIEGKETGANTTKVVGTYGYMSPEYALNGLFSVKSDVFSFGVVLLEIISGKKNTGYYESEQAMSLIGYTWKLWTENKVLDLMDSALHEVCNADQFVNCTNIGLLCVQEDPNDRPTMSNVVTMLDSETTTVSSPKRPAFVSWRGISSTASSSSKLDTYGINK